MYLNSAIGVFTRGQGIESVVYNDAKTTINYRTVRVIVTRNTINLFMVRDNYALRGSPADFLRNILIDVRGKDNIILKAELLLLRQRLEAELEGVNDRLRWG